MVNATSLNNMLLYMSNFQKTSPSQYTFSGDYISRQFQQLVQKLQSGSLPSGLKTDMYNLKTSAQNLLANNQNGALNTKTAQSDNTAISAVAQNGATYATHTFNVTQLAQAQSNNSMSLASNSATLTPGNYTFKITTGGKDTNVSFLVEEGDGSKDTLGNMAKAINDSNSGVQAQVVNDTTKGTSTLQITANNTGTDNSFQITDVNGSSAATTGIDQINTTAENAEYQLDGKQSESQSNSVTIDGGKLKVTFNQTTGKQVNVSVKDDKDAIQKGIEDYVSSYNNVVSYANSSYSGGDLSKQLKSAVMPDRGTLAGIGISIQNDGTLKIDQDRLKSELDKNINNVKRSIGGFNRLTTKSIKIADKVTTGIFDIANANSATADLSSYMKNGNKTIFNQNNVRGLFIDMML